MLNQTGKEVKAEVLTCERQGDQAIPRTHPCSLRGTHLRLLDGGGLWFGTGPSCPGTAPTGGEAGSKGCSDRAA